MDVRLGAYAVIVDDHDRVLLSHWTSPRAAAWTLPGGGMEFGEAPEQCVKREVAEETGYRVQVGDVLTANSKVLPQSRRLAEDAEGELHLLRLLYRAEITGGRLRAEVGGSSDDARWFPITELPSQRTALVALGLREAGHLASAGGTSDRG